MKSNQVIIFAIGAATGALAAQVLRPGVLEIVITLVVVIVINIFWQRRIVRISHAP
ncbi:MAG: hypothetical protein KDA96_13545 [Planctomycetaceae bacterium]|nr:hypothetical protein [Planctomycetaceae bacterium]